MMNKELVSVNDFLLQVRNIEGVVVDIKGIEDKENTYVKPYPYTAPMNGDCTVNDLITYRIMPLLRHTTVYYNPNHIQIIFG